MLRKTAYCVLFYYMEEMEIIKFLIIKDQFNHTSKNDNNGIVILHFYWAYKIMKILFFLICVQYFMNIRINKCHSVNH